MVKLLDGVKPRLRSAMRRAKPSAGKPKVVKAEAGGKSAKMPKMRPGDWACPSCSAVVFASKDTCFKCGEAKPEDAAKPKGAANLPHPSRRVSEPERAAKPEGAAGVRRDKPAPPPAQLVLVSATVPAQGGRSVGNYVAERFPTIRWLRSEGAHRPLGRLSSEFIDVADKKERQARLLELAGARWLLPRRTAAPPHRRTAAPPQVFGVLEEDVAQDARMHAQLASLSAVLPSQLDVNQRFLDTRFNRWDAAPIPNPNPNPKPDP